MKIIVICRVFNEEASIERFCLEYSFADQILLTDGGSSDKTVELVKQFDNVLVKDVRHLQIDLDSFPFVPQNEQNEILINWAKELEADWIIKDDCDCTPNPILFKQARIILEGTEEDAIFVYRLYIWGDGQYFPKYNEAGQSLWAWKPSSFNVKTVIGEISNDVLDIPEGNIRKLEEPYVLLHRFAPNEEVVNLKKLRYEALGRDFVHPLDGIYAPPEPLPDWVFEL